LICGVYGMSYPVIIQVNPGSIADELGICPGDLLVSMNGESVCDIFDYRFHAADAELSLRIGKPDGTEWDYDIEKDESEELGLEFENPLIDCEHGCTNKCVFCFVDQLPPGMRESLYFKDDDARLSFLYGNYITMTNMGEAELDRIIRYRMSPVNVSVHATNPELRVRMLGNRFAGNILERIGKLAAAGITINAQIVLCRGWNDGLELERTLADLSALAPALHSISIVPVGLTRFREGLPQLKAFDSESAGEVIKRVDFWQARLLRLVKSRTVYAADEFYLMAEAGIPDSACYEDFPQIENGVGMIASFREDFLTELESIAREKAIGSVHGVGQRVISIATGAAAADEIRNLSRVMALRIGEIPDIKVHAIANRFFGEQVTVAGLLTGRDLIGQLSGVPLGECLMVSRSMFRSDTEIMLDNVTRTELVEKLRVAVHIINPDGASLARALTYGAR
jgi:putative radical SAM enzyme (TIGR03279 family)